MIEDRHFLADPAGVALCPGAAEGLLRLQRAGRRLVVISNQSGVGRGLFTEEAVRAVNDRMVELLREAGVTLAGVYWCPHAPDAECDCRKPKPGQIHRALRELGGDLCGACVIGDRAADIDLAHNLGLTAVLVRTGYGRATEAALTTPPNFIADDLTAAADFFLLDRA
ncbi:MAG: HAD-IIIA family hydrolase [Opitutaceae bacterium]|nr:HAD-IIIA family hydrolase [Opitutaceae bacterium]